MNLICKQFEKKMFMLLIVLWIVETTFSVISKLVCCCHFTHLTLPIIRMPWLAYSVSQNKVPPKCLIFSGKSSNVIPKWYRLFKSMVHWPPKEFLFFQIGSGNQYLCQVSQFCLCTRFGWFGNLSANFKIGYNNGMCFTHWLIVMTMNVSESKKKYLCVHCEILGKSRLYHVYKITHSLFLRLYYCAPTPLTYKTAIKSGRYYIIYTYFYTWCAIGKVLYLMKWTISSYPISTLIGSLLLFRDLPAN